MITLQSILSELQILRRGAQPTGHIDPIIRATVVEVEEVRRESNAMPGFAAA
jgi:hypothetical protein